MEIKRRYQQPIVWQKAVEIVTEVYRLTASLPDTEKFGLTAQMRRAAVSQPSSIAEGAGRGTDKEFVRFLQIAKGSLFELKPQIEIAHRVGFVGEPEGLAAHTEHLFAMLNNLITKLKQ